MFQLPASSGSSLCLLLLACLLACLLVVRVSIYHADCARCKRLTKLGCWHKTELAGKILMVKEDGFKEKKS
jgi:hypothetical protein